MGRPGLTDQQKLELWRWKAGEGLIEIGLATGKHAGSIHGVVSLKGGIDPDARTLSSRQLSLLEREHMSRSLASNKSIRTIAGDLLRSHSTISREVKRNGGPVCYRAMIADNMAWIRAERPKHCILAQRPELKQTVASKLALNWSPE